MGSTIIALALIQMNPRDKHESTLSMNPEDVLEILLNEDCQCEMTKRNKVDECSRILKECMHRTYTFNLDIFRHTQS